MKLRRGCGCPIVILLLANLLFLVSGVVSLVEGVASFWGAALIILLGLGNAIVCLVAGLAAIRGQGVDGLAGTAPEPEGEDAQESE